MLEGMISPDQKVRCAEIRLSRLGQAWRAAMAVASSWESLDPEAYLHPNELRVLDSMRITRRRQTYLLGRIAAKRAIAQCAALDDPTLIEVETGILGQPLCISPLCRGLEVSISHTEESALAVTFPSGHGLGLDIESCSRTHPDLVTSQTTEAELQSARLLALGERATCAVLWTAKEALSKVLKCGLTVPMQILAIDTSSMVGEAVVCRFKNFTQYRSSTWLIGDFAISLVAPWRTEIHFDPRLLEIWFAHQGSWLKR